MLVEGLAGLNTAKALLQEWFLYFFVASKSVLALEMFVFTYFVWIIGQSLSLPLSINVWEIHTQTDQKFTKIWLWQVTRLETGNAKKNREFEKLMGKLLWWPIAVGLPLTAQLSCEHLAEPPLYVKTWRTETYLFFLTNFFVKKVKWQEENGTVYDANFFSPILLFYHKKCEKNCQPWWTPRWLASYAGI